MHAESTLTRLATGYGLLEGARWYDELGLVYSDMLGGGVYALAPGGAPRPLIPHRKAIGGLVAHAAGGLVISGRNVARKELTADGATDVLLETQADEQFFNDLTADAAGRVYAGSVGKGGAGRLYRIDLDRTVTVLADDVLVSNGLGTDPTETVLYHVDSDRHRVWQFPLTAAGRDVFVDTSEYAGVPDGLAVAGDGSVWVAIAGGAVVVGWDGVGNRIAEIGVPQALVTSVCFGGRDLDSLYVLTGVTDEHPDPDGGCIFVTPAPTRGRPAPLARV